MVILFFCVILVYLCAPNFINMRKLHFILLLSALFLGTGVYAQGDASYKLTNKGVIKTIESAVGVEQYNIAKPIVLLKPRYELDTEEGYSRFSIESARLGVKGDLSKLLSYCFQIDFCAENKLNVLDLYAVIKPLDRLSFTVGQHGLSLFNPWTVSPNAVDFINRPFIGKWFTSSRDIGVTMKYALKKNGFPINLEFGVYNGSGINNPTWNKSLATGGKIEFGSTTQGFRMSGRFYNVKDENGNADLYLGGDLRYVSQNLKLEAEYMTKQYGTEIFNDINKSSVSGTNGRAVLTNAKAHSAAHVQGMYKINVKSNTFSRIEPLVRWDAIGYDVHERGFGVNRITAGANFVLKTVSCTSMFRINYEHFITNSMDMSEMFKNGINCDNKLSVEYLLYF